MNKRRGFIFIIALVMVFASFSSVFAAVYLDTAGHWAETDIIWATENGYLRGDGNGYFRPEDTVTRAEFVTGINRLINSSAKAIIRFPDVQSQNWYYDEISKGVYNGIIEDSTLNFRPNEAITRDDAARIVARAYKLVNYLESATIFKDYSNISNKGEVGALVSKKVLNGWPDGFYYPGKTLTRAEYSKILRSAVQYLGLPTLSVSSRPIAVATWDWYYGKYNHCELELSDLASAIREGKIELAKTTKYTEKSLEMLKEAVDDGEDTYNLYKNDYRYNYYENCPYQGTINASIKKINDAINELKLIVKVISIEVSPTSESVEEGQTVQLTATVKPADATNKKVTWKSSDKSIATVDSKGLVTAVAVGKATITATTEDGGKTATSIITVTPAPVAVTGIEVSPTSESIEEGKTVKLTATVKPTDATNKKVTWKSSDESIATVDENGLVTAVAEGEATITVTTEDGGRTATSTITVTPLQIEVTSVEVSPTSESIEEGKTVKLTATVKPTDATNKKVTWKSSDESIATVDANGLVTAVAEGEATITVTTDDGGKTATSTITVTPKKYNVTYRFETTTGGTIGIEDVHALRPEDTKVKSGTNITPNEPAIGTKISNLQNETFTFKGYTPEKVENISNDVTFVGKWERLIQSWTVAVFEEVDGKQVKIENASITFTNVEDGTVYGPYTGSYMATITDFIPGEYTVKVTAPEFNDYEKTQMHAYWSGVYLTRK